MPPPDLFVRFSGVGNNPWEIGRTQTEIVQLVRQGIFHGKLLDIGCGIGVNAIYITTHGNNVRLTGIDLVNEILFFSLIDEILFSFRDQLKLHIKERR